MAEMSFRKLFVFGLLFSLITVCAGSFYNSFVTGYGVPASDLKTINKTQEIMNQIENAGEQIRGTTDDVSDFGVFVNTFKAIGNILDTLWDFIDLLFSMIYDINSRLGGGVIGGYVLTFIEGVFLVTVAYLAMKTVLGGRI